MRSFFKNVGIYIFFLLASAVLVRSVSARVPTAADTVLIDEKCNAAFPGNNADTGYCRSCFEVGVRAGDKDVGGGSLPVTSKETFNDVITSCSSSFSNAGIINKCTDCQTSGAFDKTYKHADGSNGKIVDEIVLLAQGKLVSDKDIPKPGDPNLDKVVLPFPFDNNDPTKAGPTLKDDVKKQIVDRCNTEQPGGGTAYDNCLKCSAIAAIYGTQTFETLDACNVAQGSQNLSFCRDFCVRSKDAGAPDKKLDDIVDKAQADIAAEEAADADKGMGAKATVIDFMGVNCGMPGTPYDRCCRPPKVAFKISLNGLKVTAPGAPKSGWGLNPLRWPSKVLQGVINVPVGVAEGIANFIGGSIFHYGNTFSEKANENIIGSENIGCPDGSQATVNGAAATTMSQINDPACKCPLPIDPNAEPDTADPSVLAASTNATTSLCANLTGTEKDSCNRCTARNGGVVNGAWTAIGCIPNDVGRFVQETVFPIGFSLAGVTALLTMIYSAFLMQTSQGNPEKVKRARQYLNSALLGLGVIIFSVFILQIIGVDILRIPGFTSK